MLKECEKACVYSLDGVFLTEVKVVNSDNDSMGLIFEEKDMDKVNTETVIVFYDGLQGLVTCRCRLSARVKINGTHSGDTGGAVYKVPCQIDKLIGVEQRRSDLKVRVSLPVMLEAADADGKVAQIPAEVKDISAGGVGFESDYELAKEQPFTFLFETDTGCTRLKGSILWVEKLSEEEASHYRYGSCFYDLTSYQESMIRKFAFQEQLKRRKIQ